MLASEVQSITENYQERVVKRREELTNRLFRSASMNPIQEESIYIRIEELDKFDSVLFDSGALTDRELAIIQRRMNGMTLEEIGRVFLVGRERIRQILAECYKKISEEYNSQFVS